MSIPWPFLRLAPEDEDVSKHLETVAPLSRTEETSMIKLTGSHGWVFQKGFKVADFREKYAKCEETGPLENELCRCLTAPCFEAFLEVV